MPPDSDADARSGTDIDTDGDGSGAVVAADSDSSGTPDADSETETAPAADLSALLSSATLVFVGTVLSSGLKLFERVLVGRTLTRDAYGEFSLALSVFVLGTTLGVAGFSQGVPRYMARFEDPRDVRGAWLTGLVVTLVASGLIVGVLVVAAPVIVPRLFESTDGTTLFFVFVVSIPVFVAFRVGVAGIRGRENTVYKLLTQNVGYPVVRLALVGSLLWLNVGLLATGFGYLGALVTATAFTYVLLNRLVPLRGRFRLHVRDMTAFSAPLVVSTITSTLLTETDTLMLGYFRASSEVGTYAAAYPLARALTLVLAAFGYLYLPLASRLDASEDEEGSVERVYQVTTKWMFVLVLPLFSTLVVFPDVVVTAVFGDDYLAAGTALSILAVGFFTNAAVGRNRETLSALGATKFILAANVAAFVANFALNLALIPPYGFVGAAVASASSALVLNAVVYAVLRRRYGITPFTRRSFRALVALPVAVLSVGGIAGAVLPGTILVAAAVTPLLGAVAVVTLALVGGLEPEDIVVVEFVEDHLGLRLPLIRRYVPDES